MTNDQIYKNLENIEKQVKYLMNQLRENKEMSPTQRAIATITGSKSTSEHVRAALDVLYNSPEPLSYKQVAFCVFFAMLNHSELGEDIDSWVRIELGKHKYNERTSFIEQVQQTIEANYKSSIQFKTKLFNYLESKKK